MRRLTGSNTQLLLPGIVSRPRRFSSRSIGGNYTMQDRRPVWPIIAILLGLLLVAALVLFQGYRLSDTQRQLRETQEQLQRERLPVQYI